MIIRGPRPADRFAQIHNALLQDGRLSYKARGLAADLLSRPPGWRTSSEQLASQNKDGRDAIRTGLRELERYGYLVRARSHKPDGTWEHHQIITDVPGTIDGESVTGEPDIDLDTMDGKSVAGESVAGKAVDINNTEPNNTYLSTDVDGSPVNSPAVSGAPASHHGNDHDPRDGDGGPRLKQRRGWYPSDAALETAYNTVTLMDIPVHIARYTVVKAEKKSTPTSAEWLRWLLADEQVALKEQRKQDRDEHTARPWYGVAD